jgi:hypothetical protein
MDRKWVKLIALLTVLAFGLTIIAAIVVGIASGK